MLTAESKNMIPIAHIRTCFPTKFGIPRQSGIGSGLESTIVFEPEYRNVEALRGLEEFSHIWLIWEFSEAKRDSWSPTVRPPRLGGNTRKGVFATRSPFRPNPIGLSCVKLERIESDKNDGPFLIVSGADLMDGTPIFDIKPYLPYADCITDATSGFAPQAAERLLQVVIDEQKRNKIPTELYEGLVQVLAHDPRPQYHDDPERIYTLPFADMEVRFKVKEDILEVTEIQHIKANYGRTDKTP